MYSVRPARGAAFWAMAVLLLVPACGFQTPAGSPGPSPSPFQTGGEPTGALFCNIETTRRCATDAEQLAGVNIARQYEDGFWVSGKGSGPGPGLDASPAARAACGGQAQAVLFLGPFPSGSIVCASPAIFNAGGPYLDANAACQAYCGSLGLIDTDRHRARCDHIAWHSTGAENVLPNACTAAGIPHDFQDLRTFRPKAVVWKDTFGVDVMENSLRRVALPPAWNAGAASTSVLRSGDGYLDFTAIETNTDRMCGLSVGDAMDSDPSFGDLDFAVFLQSNGTLRVYEEGRDIGQSQPYGAGDRVRVAVVGGIVQYFKNGRLFYTSAAPVAYPLRADASLYAPGATLSEVETSF